MYPPAVLLPPRQSVMQPPVVAKPAGSTVAAAATAVVTPAPSALDASLLTDVSAVSARQSLPRKYKLVSPARSARSSATTGDMAAIAANAAFLIHPPAGANDKKADDPNESQHA
jgi:hypothetical protein